MSEEQQQPQTVRDAVDGQMLVESDIRSAMREAAQNVIGIGTSAPTEDFKTNADEAASSANVATVWTNILGGLGRALGEFRHSHVDGAESPLQPQLEATANEVQRLDAVLTKIGQEAAHGASPTKIAQLVDEARRS